MIILRHAAFTWLVAHAIHLFIWIIRLLLMEGYLNPEGMAAAFLVCLIAMVFSIPAIFFFCLINKLIINSSLFPSDKFFLWLVSASLITAINGFLFTMLLSAADDPHIVDNEVFLFALPSIVATALSVAVRYQQFFKLNEEITEANKSS